VNHVEETGPTDGTETFTVRWVGGNWFVGTQAASQRIEDGAWLDTWLAANGADSRAVLSFGGSHALRERFVLEHGPISDG
jgi:hypothetical protein